MPKLWKKQEHLQTQDKIEESKQNNTFEKHVSPRKKSALEYEQEYKNAEK